MASALESLIRILEQLLLPEHQHLIPNEKHQIDSLLKKARFLVEKCWRLPSGTSGVKGLKDQSGTIEMLPSYDGRILNLEKRIKEAALVAETTLESHISNQAFLPADEGVACPLDLKLVMDEFDSIKEEAKMVSSENLVPKTTEKKKKKKKKKKSVGEGLLLSEPLDHPVTRSRRKRALVGLEEHFEHLLPRLTGPHNNSKQQLEVIALIGFGGTGKTTLARQLYDSSSVDVHFDTRVWIRNNSEEENGREIVLDILGGLTTLTNKMGRENVHDLGGRLLKRLRGKRYLIVLDDVRTSASWIAHTWETIKSFFTDDKNGSRIMLITRILAAIDIKDPPTYPFLLDYMDEMQVSRIFSDVVFGEEEGCPPMLVPIRNRIVAKCQGHPMVTTVIGSLLKKSTTREHWERVCVDLTAAVSLNSTVPNALCLGYHYLPRHLRPCYLYMGAFPEEFEIRASKIVKLWIAEGFLKPIANKTWEDAAEMYLEELVDRNLLTACLRESNGRLKTFSISRLLKNTCLSYADDENFLWSVDQNACSVLFRGLNEDSKQKMELVRSFFSFEGVPSSLDLAPLLLAYKLLRVLDVFEIEFYQFPTEILELINLRYLALTFRSALPASISRFWFLQTLIVRRLPSFRALVLPSVVWEMTQLRHIKSKEACFFYYDPLGDGDDDVVQENMQTLSHMRTCGVNSEVLAKFPNLRSLGLFCDIPLEAIIDLTTLQVLEKLKCSSDWSPATRDFLSFLTLPTSLNKLTLSFCRIPRGFMATIGKLPNLELLKLRHCDFQDANIESETDETAEAEWEPAVGEFRRLKSLVMNDLNLVQWRAGPSNFPSLRHLSVRECLLLREFPSDIGYIPTLEQLEVAESNPSVLTAARKIKKEQNSLGNGILQVVVCGS